MDTKICKKCGIEKSLDCFRKRENYYENVCKDCTRKRARITAKLYRQTHSEEIKKTKQKWESLNKERHKLTSKKWKENNKEKIKEYNKMYKLKNKEKIDKQNEDYRKNNREKCCNATKKYYQNNKEKINKYANEYKRTRARTDKVYRLKLQARRMINNSFRRNGHTKKEKSEEILNCSIDYFIKHLLESFENNYGYEWNGVEEVDIDHIIPLSTAKTEEEVIKLCHYTNLQLLKHVDNLKKSNNINWKIQEE